MGSYLLPRFFPYDTRSFQRTLRIYAAAIIGLTAVGFLMLRLSPGALLAAYLIMLSALVVLVLMLVGPVPHLRTQHCVTGDAVILRQGLGFRLVVPFSNMAFIKQQETTGKSGIRVDRADGTLYVLATGMGGVRMGLREPMANKGGAFDQIVLDVEDPEGLVQSVKERRKARLVMRRLEKEPTPAKLLRRAPLDEEVTGQQEVPVEEEAPDDQEAPVDENVAADPEALDHQEPPEKPRRKKAAGDGLLVPLKKRASRYEEGPPARMVRIPKNKDD